MVNTAAQLMIKLAHPVEILGYVVDEIAGPKPVRLAEAHRFVQVTTTYTPAGAVKSVRDTATVTFSNAHAAFRALVKQGECGRGRFADQNTSVRHEVRLHTNATVALFDYYAAVIGNARITAQLADPHFSINLDTWLVEFVAKRDETFE